MSRLNDYVAYFRRLAVLNKSICHEPASEHTEAPSGAVKRFTRFSTDEVTSAIRSRIDAGPVLHLHNYEWQLQDNGAFALQRSCKAAFMVTRHASLTDFDAQVAAHEQTERIVDELLEKIRLDVLRPGRNRCCSPFGFIDFNTVRVVSVGPLWDGRYGWYVTFDFQWPPKGLPSAACVDEAFHPDPSIQCDDDELMGATSCLPLNYHELAGGKAPKTIPELPAFQAGSTNDYYLAVHKPGEPSALRISLSQVGEGNATKLRWPIVAGDAGVGSGDVITTGLPPRNAPELVVLGGLIIHDFDWNPETSELDLTAAGGAPPGTKILLLFF